jgi:predicted Zn-dependent protease
LLYLRLFNTNPLIHARIRREALEEAIREEPRHPVVSAELARLREVPLLPALRTGAGAKPNDGRGWYLLALEATDPGEHETALRQSVERWPDGALAHAALAGQLAITGRAREALPLANRAMDLAPWHPTAVATLATVAVELGQCKQALILQERVVEAVKSKAFGSHGTSATEVRDRLGEIRKRCATAPGTVYDGGR